MDHFLFHPFFDYMIFVGFFYSFPNKFTLKKLHLGTFSTKINGYFPVFVAIFEYHFFIESGWLQLRMIKAFAIVNEMNWNMVGPEAVDLL